MTTYPCCPHCVDDQPHVPLDSHTLPCTTCEAEDRIKARSYALTQACVPEGCQCTCHRYPGVSHIRACCEQPTYYHRPSDTHAPIEPGSPVIDERPPFEQRSSRIHRLGVKGRPEIEITVDGPTYDYLLSIDQEPLTISKERLMQVHEDLANDDWCRAKVLEVHDANPFTSSTAPSRQRIAQEVGHPRINHSVDRHGVRHPRPDEVASLEALGERHGFRVEHPQEQMSREGHEVDRAYREEHQRQPREHAVLCSRCRKVTTWNVDAICDPCLDRLPEAPEWTL